LRSGLDPGDSELPTLLRARRSGEHRDRITARQLGDDDEADQVLVGIETDRRPWVQALIAAGYLDGGEKGAAVVRQKNPPRRPEHGVWDE
jgi:hypothetical protein